MAILDNILSFLNNVANWWQERKRKKRINIVEDYKIEKAKRDAEVERILAELDK